MTTCSALRGYAPDRWRGRARVPRQRPPAALRKWLWDRGSLTRRIKAVCGGGFRVEVLSQSLAAPLADERRALGIAPRRLALVREVFLHCDGRPLVFARSVIPRQTLRLARQHLGPLDTRPLGEVLFTDPHVERGASDIARLDPGDAVHAHIDCRFALGNAPVWGRRSVFQVHGHPLLVAEIFLPGLPGFPG